MIFGTSRDISRKNSEVEGCHSLIVDMTDVQHLGVSAALALEEAILDMIRANRHVYISGANEQSMKRLTDMGLIKQLAAKCIKETRQEAIEAASS